MITAADIQAFSDDLKKEQEGMIEDLIALQAALNYFITASIVSATKFGGHTTNMTVIQSEALLKQTMKMAGVPSEVRQNIVDTVNNSHKTLFPKPFMNQPESAINQSASLLKAS